jgi:hypothetical protein
MDGTLVMWFAPLDHMTGRSRNNTAPGQLRSSSMVRSNFNHAFRAEFGVGSRVFRRTPAGGQHRTVVDVFSQVLGRQK